MDQALAPVAFTALATFGAKPEDAATPRHFAGIAYGGGVVTDHPLFERVAFDLSSTTLKTPAAALFDHGVAVGVIKSAALSGKIDIAGDLFSDVNQHAKNIADMADRGMPWQMSVRIYPGQIDQVAKGKAVELNGQTMTGPLTVFRQNRVREVSFVALGADDSTDAHVFSVSEGGSRPPIQKEPNMNDENTISRADHDAALATLKTTLTTQFDAEKKTLTDRLEALEAKFTAQRHAARTAAIEALCKAAGMEFKAGETDKHYLDMTDEQFSAVEGMFKARKPALDPKLAEVVAKDGLSAHADAMTTGNDAAAKGADIAAKAALYIAAQAAVGNKVTPAQAVKAVVAAAATV